MLRPYSKTLVIALLSGSALSMQTFASDYNLVDVYKLAIENDAQMAAAKAGRNATLEKLPQARTLFLPTLALKAEMQKSNAATETTAGELNRSNNTHGWGASLTQPLFNLNSWFSYGQAKAVTAQAEYSYSFEEQSLMLRVSEAYFNGLRAEDRLFTAKAEEKAVRQQLDQAQERYKVGLIAEADVLETQAAYDLSRVARILANNQLSVSYENLRTITNENINRLGQLKKSMPVQAPVPAVAEDWVKTAITNNLALKAAREGLKAAEDNIKAKMSGHAPKVEAFASYNQGYDKSRDGTRLADNSDILLTGSGSQTVFGINMTLPIFTGGGTSSQVREANYLSEQAQRNFDKLLRETSSGTRSYFWTVKSDVERAEAQKQGMVSSQSALKATQSGYDVGTRNMSDVLNAQKKLYAAQRDYLNARYDFIINTLKLKQLAGTLSPADLQELNQWITFEEEESTASIIK